MSVNLPKPGPEVVVPGVRLATGAAGIKALGRDDLVLLSLAEGATLGGLFTQSGFRAAPVEIAEARVEAGGVRALLINSGNANAATGLQGHEDALALCEAAATALGVPTASVLPFSTGVIGERLPIEVMLPEVENLVSGLGEANWLAAALAIMTTDTAPKLASRTVEIDGVTVTLAGMAKGAGMIRPDMATMLAFVCCDAKISKPCLDALSRDAANASFNRITIDGDTSTNDSLIIAATGLAGHPLIDDRESEPAALLRAAVIELCQQLAQCVVRDGEGATKFVTVRVEGGADAGECLQVAYTVAESPLVKTALFAGDPNWGRLAMAIGRARVPRLEQQKVSAWFDSVQVMAAGVKASDYAEEAGAGVLARDEFTIRIDLGRGDAAEEIWTSDLSYEYVRINAEYRT